MQNRKLPRLLFKNVLVPVDGSENSYRALLIALAIVKKYKARLLLIHVIQTPAYLRGHQFESEYMPIVDREARRIVDEGLFLARKYGIDATGKIQYAPSVVEAIAGYASKKKVKLIVTGTRGLSGFKKLLLGGVASGIVSHAHCEVLVVR